MSLNSDQLLSYKIKKNDAGISSAQIAAQLGIGEAVVVAWEDGSIRVSAQQAQAYGNAVAALT